MLHSSKSVSGAGYQMVYNMPATTTAATTLLTRRTAASQSEGNEQSSQQQQQQQQRSVQQQGGASRGSRVSSRRPGFDSTRRMFSSPFDMMLDALESDLDEIFSGPGGSRRGGLDPFGRGSRALQAFGESDWVPKVNIAETDSTIHVHAELPGVKKEDIKVEIDDEGMLMLRGERKQEKKEEDKSKRYTRIESSFGSFERRIALPDGVSQEDVKAKFNDGVLEVDVQKPTRRKANPINVE